VSRHAFHLVNVFAGSTLSGNALCVFEDGTALTDGQMQDLALQFNLSETTFVFPSPVATARIRIFTPTFEMPFAGHPTLGSAHVVRMLRGGTLDALTLETGAGVIPLTATGNAWTLQPNAPRVRPVDAPSSAIAGMLGLGASDLGDSAMWVDTGSEQLVIPLRTAEAVDRCRPEAAMLVKHASNAGGQTLAYVWAHEDNGDVRARFFFFKGSVLTEDPGTGSACANLGGYLVATAAPLPVALTVHQGEHTGRACRLGLRVDAEKRIFVSGDVIAIGRGEVIL
jgi:trans-2,3-dihydro-3-hydroxyanthranilate isomerase